MNPTALPSDHHAGSGTTGLTMQHALRHGQRFFCHRGAVLDERMNIHELPAIMYICIYQILYLHQLFIYIYNYIYIILDLSIACSYAILLWKHQVQ